MNINGESIKARFDRDIWAYVFEEGISDEQIEAMRSVYPKCRFEKWGDRATDELFWVMFFPSEKLYERKRMNDAVNHPSHYIRGGVECIDHIEKSLRGSYKGYLLGNAIKYIWRHDAKGKPIEDLNKARWYLNRYRDDIKFDPYGWWKRVMSSPKWDISDPDEVTIEFLRHKALRYIECYQIDHAIMIVDDMIRFYENTFKGASL